MTHPPAARPPGPRTPREVMGTLAELLIEEYRVPRVCGAVYRSPWRVAGVLSLPGRITVWLTGGGTTLAWRAGGDELTWPARDVLGAAEQIAACLPARYRPCRGQANHPEMTVCRGDLGCRCRRQQDQPRWWRAQQAGERRRQRQSPGPAPAAAG